MKRFTPLVLAGLIMTTGCSSIKTAAVADEQLSADLNDKKISIVYSNTGMLAQFPADALADMDILLVSSTDEFDSEGQPIEKKEDDIYKDLTRWEKILLVHEKQSVPQLVIDGLFKATNIIIVDAPLVTKEEGAEVAALQAFNKSDSDYMFFLRGNGVFSYKTFEVETQYLSYTGTLRLLKKSPDGVVSVWERKCHIGPMEGEKQEVHNSDIFKGKGEQLEAVLTFVSDECVEQLKPELQRINLL